MCTILFDFNFSEKCTGCFEHGPVDDHECYSVFLRPLAITILLLKYGQFINVLLKESCAEQKSSQLNVRPSKGKTRGHWMITRFGGR